MTKTVRVVVIVLAVAAAVAMMTWLASLVPDPPAPCSIPGHARAVSVECEVA